MEAAAISHMHADVGKPILNADDERSQLCMYKSGKCSEKRAWKNGKQLKLCEAHRLEQNAIKMRSDKSLSMRRKVLREEKKRNERLRRVEERKKMYWEASWAIEHATMDEINCQQSPIIPSWNGPLIDIGDELVTATCLQTLERLGNDVLLPLYEQHPDLDERQKLIVMKVAMVQLQKKMMQQLLHMEQAGWILATPDDRAC